MVLLDCMQRLSRRLRLRLRALHVNHQLSPSAARWEEFCRRQCRNRKIPYSAVKVVVPREASLEAAARAARYSVFCTQKTKYVALAQHQDDQVETLLLQLLRGAGVRGLAAMPVARGLIGGRRKTNRAQEGSGSARPPVILRPMLDVTRAEILDYARQRHLEWIEDESNTNTDIRRNFLRHEVLPLIGQRFPSYRATIARSARHLAEAGELLDDLALTDGAGSLGNGMLQLAALRGLPDARARNLLRFFLAQNGVNLPNVERLKEALRQVLTARQDARVAVALGETTLRRYQGRLYLAPELSAPPRGFTRAWRGERELALPELGGILGMGRARGEGISVARLGALPVTVRARRGGERLQLVSGRPRRSLKNLMQESRVPPWQRDRLPLLFCGNRLIWVPEIGVASDFRARRGEASVQPHWRWGGAGT